MPCVLSTWLKLKTMKFVIFNIAGSLIDYYAVHSSSRLYIAMHVIGHLDIQYIL